MANLSSQSMTEFCEQVDPGLLLEMRYARPFPDMLRLQESWVAAAEKRALLWLAGRTPHSIGPDHLTALGMAAQIGAGACYALASRNRWALLGVIVCLAVNWLGDSLDGTLARVRQRLRPRYGFYVDHMVDSFGAVALMGGLARSGYMHPWIAIGLLVAFLMLSIQSYLAPWASFASRSGVSVQPNCAFCWQSGTWLYFGNRSSIFSAEAIACSMSAAPSVSPEWL